MYNLISTVIGNLKVTISNVHIRYEDSVRLVEISVFNFSLFCCILLLKNVSFDLPSSNSGHPFASGFTLSKLAAVTVDEDGNETFDAGVALDKLRKVRTHSFIFLLLL